MIRRRLLAVSSAAAAPADSGPGAPSGAISANVPIPMIAGPWLAVYLEIPPTSA